MSTTTRPRQRAPDEDPMKAEQPHVSLRGPLGWALYAALQELAAELAHPARDPAGTAPPALVAIAPGVHMVHRTGEAVGSGGAAGGGGGSARQAACSGPA